MIKILLPKNIEIFTDFRTQRGTIGKPFRCAGPRKNLQIPPIWIGKVEKFHWIYTFLYIGTDTFFTVEVDYDNNFVKFVKN